MKHISTDKLFVQKLVSDGVLKLAKVHKDVNVADLGTKYVDKRTLERLVKLLGAFWLQSLVKVADAIMAMKAGNNANAEDMNNANKQVTVHTTVEEFVLTAELEDWVMVVALISLTVQLGCKLFENVVLGGITAVISRMIRKFCRKRNDEKYTLNLEFCTAIHGSNVCHLNPNCGHMKRIATSNRKAWKICDDCERYLEQETERVLQWRLEDEV